MNAKQTQNETGSDDLPEEAREFLDRIVPKPTQFGIGDILAVTACIALVIAFCQWGLLAGPSLSRVASLALLALALWFCFASIKLIAYIFIRNRITQLMKSRGLNVVDIQLVNRTVGFGHLLLGRNFRPLDYRIRVCDHRHREQTGIIRLYFPFCLYGAYRLTWLEPEHEN